jgi:hypothetical protein
MGILDWLCKHMCRNNNSESGSYTVSFTKDEAKKIRDTRNKLRHWLELAGAGTIGNLANGVKEYIMDIIDASNQLYDLYVPPFTVIVEELSPLTVSNLIDDLKSKGGMRGWLRLDRTYYTVTIDMFKKIIYWDWTDTKKYLYDMFNCNKFAMYFKARLAINFGFNAVGVILDYSAGRAYNLVILRDPRGVSYYLYEPQNDNLFTYEQRDKKMYAMEDYYLIL